MPTVQRAGSGATVTGIATLCGFSDLGRLAVNCADSDVAGVSIFNTESNALAATDRTLTWVNAHIRELVVLPVDAMFSGGPTSSPERRRRCALRAAHSPKSGK